MTTGASSKVRIFSNGEVSRAITHVKRRAPDIIEMMEKCDLGLMVVKQEEWTSKMFSLAPIIKELGVTNGLSEGTSLLFFVRKELRRRNGIID